MTRGNRNEGRKVLLGGVDAALPTTVLRKARGSLIRKGVKRTVEYMGRLHRPVYAAKAS